MRFSVVVPTHNRRDLLERVVAAILDQTLPREHYELIVVDDGSRDGSEALGEALAGRLGFKFIRQDNRGPAAARNRGIAEATGEVVAFTDDDCLVPRDWLERLADGYRRHSQVAGVGGGLRAPEEVLARSAVARLEAFIAREVYGVGGEERLGGFECPAGGTNNMSYRREVLLEVGGFDESFGPDVSGEEADLKLRITQRGGLLLYVPVWVEHLRDYSLGCHLRQSFQRGRGEAHFRLKHEGRRGWLRALVRLAAAPAKLLAAPLGTDPGRRAAAAAGQLAHALGVLSYRPGR